MLSAEIAEKAKDVAFNAGFLIRNYESFGKPQFVIDC
jgi:hypothetical protein